ncbi:MAG: exodeoxyribonuclease VII large subunit [Alphaproteobacteria bacterium]|jgi:exodeoxyribonuclease VII large subunit
MWKGTTSRLNFNPEDGLEVLATGKVTTFAGRSQYQIIVDGMEPAGVGALMALLEKRKAQFTAEGLFDQSRKQAIPFLPKVIAILTSETGAVIRDIIHRLKDRYMPHVLLLPIAVQGDLSAKQVAYGVKLFNKFDDTTPLPRPDIIIIARGGGSIEDLWSFNEEIVVRSIAASNIPVISAVGHETDFTLCDFAADLRAPTPTAAAEMAVPVKRDLMMHLMTLETRLLQALQNNVSLAKEQIGKIRLPQLDRLLAEPRQNFDHITQRLPIALKNIVSLKKSLFHEKSSGLKPEPLKKNVISLKRDVAYLEKQHQQALINYQSNQHRTLESLQRMLDIMSYKSVLKRGFVAVKDSTGHYLSQKPDNLPKDTALNLEFYDGDMIVKSL